MSALADKIRRARESKVEAGGHTFTIRRPTDVEAMALTSADVLEAVCRHTIGWDLIELDLDAGGTDVALPFDADAFREWVADQPDTLTTLADGILQAYQAHAEKRGAAQKN